MAKWELDCTAENHGPRPGKIRAINRIDGDDIVARLERVAIYAENVMEDEHYKKRLMLAEGVADLIYEAMDKIVDLRAQLFNEQEAKQ
jgi:hypothetical protein